MCCRNFKLKLSKLNQLIDDSKVIAGKWAVTPNHEIEYKSKGLNEEIKFKGSLIAAEPEAIVFSVTERQEDQKIVTSIHKITGTWRANAKNQLVFEVEKESGKKDSLTFKGKWEIGKANEIVYTADISRRLGHLGEEPPHLSRRRRLKPSAFSANGRSRTISACHLKSNTQTGNAPSLSAETTRWAKTAQSK